MMTPNDPSLTTDSAKDAPAAAPRVTVIIPVKGASTLPPCLDSLENQDIDEPYQVIVVDGWHDDEVAAVAGRYDRVVLIRSRENLLQCVGRNIAAQQTDCEYIVFLDADCVAEPSYVSSAVKVLDDGARMVGGPVLDARPWNPFAVADNFSQFADFSVTRPSGPAEYFPGCNMAMRTADFLAIGGFPDTKMPAGEDTLLCLKMAEHFPDEPDAIRYENAMRIKHIGRTTPSGFLKHQRFFGYVRASCGLKMTMKHRKLGRSVFAIPALVFKRYRYMLGQTLSGPNGGAGNLPKVILTAPFVLTGMLWWGWGFRQACREPIQPYSLLYGQET